MGKRIVVVFSGAILVFSVLIIRLYSLTQSDYLVQAAQKQSTYSVGVTRTRGGIYDCNLQRLTDTEKTNRITVLPSAESMEAVAAQVTGRWRSSILEQIQSRLPFVAYPGENKVYSPDIENFTITQRYTSPMPAPHIIGYINGDGNGVSGIELAYQDFLRDSGESVTANYVVDAQSLPFENQRPTLSGSTQPPAAGVVLSLDKEIQEIASKAAQETQLDFAQGSPSQSAIEKGAVVVMDAKSGKIKASVSLPEFSPDQVNELLTDPSAPLYNRAFASYSVGSTFKLAVAAAALEHGSDPNFSVDCVGGTTVSNRIFYCHNRAGHRVVNLEKAIEQSCNPYFVALGQQAGSDNILNMAQAMGFGSSTVFAPGVESQAGSLPAKSDAANPHELANLSFGQGKLSATPIQIASMVSSVANGGLAVIPSLVEGTTQDGVLIDPPPQYVSNRIMSVETAKFLQRSMIGVVENGSGSAGKPTQGGAGGKTASAQTGKYDEEGLEIVHAWFAGFFPAEEPKYTVVVLVEGGEFGGKIASPIFKRIADQITVLEKERAAN